MALVASGAPAVKENTRCFRCWKTGVHYSWDCEKPGKVCEACGNDGGKPFGGFSCGGEYDKSKCMVKGFDPKCYVPPKLMDKINDAGKAITAKQLDDKKPDATALVAGGVDMHNCSWTVENGEFVARLKNEK
jgi:hypothetical protein